MDEVLQDNANPTTAAVSIVDYDMTQDTTFTISTLVDDRIHEIALVD